MTTSTRVGTAWVATWVLAVSGGCGADPGQGWGTIADAGSGERGGADGVDATTDAASSAEAGSSPGSGSGLPCDVDSVLAANCRSCHGAVTAYGAPESLVTYADLHAQAKTDPTKKVYELVETLLHASAGTMPPPPAAPLSAAETAPIDAWVQASAPLSNESCAGDGTQTADAGLDPTSLSCTPDTLIRAPSAFAIDPTLPDQYVCYGFDVTTAQKRHVIAFGPHVDNKAVVHHMLLFQASESYSPTPTPCDAFGSAAWNLVGGWAPGGQPFEVPPEAGFPEEGTTHWILQVHYNNVKGLTGQTDASGYDLCTTDQLRPNDADVLAVGSVSFSLPPRSTVDLSCNYTHLLGPIHVFAVTPHMHLLGTSMESSDVTSSATIVNQPFNFQAQLAVPTSLDIASGDVINTHCVWENSTDQTVSFGENTGNEMCFGFLQYYPKITFPLWSWTTPSDLASCTSTTH